ncbi:MAG: methylated-DNA--[protein]-cysteine S-methyltransferase [Nocardioidaceae bacterium]|nr:methylated-DNA--[protein]-cysteine S-methyltransferase [Nocardioidaceae bacterium]
MWTTLDSPVGELRVIAHKGAVTAIEFDGPRQAGLSARSSAVQAAVRSAGRPVGDRADDDALLVEVRRQLDAYFARDLKEFDLPLAPDGSPFQLQGWQQLRTIGYGDTATYGEIAGRLGMTGHGARAVGLANGRNPIPIVIPCHRVVGADGTLTGYAGGVERKQLLLDLETEALF